MTGAKHKVQDLKFNSKLKNADLCLYAEAWQIVYPKFESIIGRSNWSEASPDQDSESYRQQLKELISRVWGDNYDPTIVIREKIVIKLADGKEREFQHMTSKMFYSVDGKPMSLTEFIQSLFNTLEMPDLFKSEDELRAIWAVPSTRAKLLKQLEDAGFPASELLSIQELIDAQNSDLFDVLEFVKYALKPVTRKTRATLSRSIMEVGIEAKQLEFIDFLVSQYIESGVGELEESKLETLLEIKYTDVFNAIKIVGNGEVSKVRQLFLDFQKGLYQPRKEYQGVS